MIRYRRQASRRRLGENLESVVKTEYGELIDRSGHQDWKSPIFSFIEKAAKEAQDILDTFVRGLKTDREVADVRASEWKPDRDHDAYECEIEFSVPGGGMLSGYRVVQDIVDREGIGKYRGNIMGSGYEVQYFPGGRVYIELNNGKGRDSYSLTLKADIDIDSVIPR